MEATAKTWLSDGVTRTGKTAIMRVSEDEKLLLEAYRRRLGLRSEAQVLRMALELLQTLMDRVEMLGVSVDAVVTAVTQGEAAAVPLLLEAMEQHPDWLPDERQELMDSLRSKISRLAEAPGMERPHDA
jgi:hypothetical protein